MEPRRESKAMKTMNDALECEAGCSFVNEKKIEKKISYCVKQKGFDKDKGNLNTTIALPDIDI